MLLLVNQVVVRRIAKPAGPALVQTAEIGAAGIEDISGPRRRRAGRESSRVPKLDQPARLPGS